MDTIEVRHVPPGGSLKDFLDVVTLVYKGDPAFTRPLDEDLKDRLNPKKNPFFEHGEGAVFTAHRNGRCVGRITASIDREHLERYRDETGFFGFLDTIDDADVSSALLAKAEEWLRARGMKHARGPVSINVNEEMGCLVEGFDTPPFILMPHHHPYQAELITRTKKAQEVVRAMPEVTTRTVSYKEMERDVELIVDIFNDAWSDNWGFVPITLAEVKKMASDFKLFLIPEITRIVSIEGEPAAVAVAVPNLNELVKDLDGKLFPFGIFKLLYRLKIVGAKSGRVLILGIRKKWRNVKKYAALSIYLYAELNESGKKIGMTHGELGWTLEDNGPVNAGIRAMGADPYKRYRVFTKALA